MSTFYYYGKSLLHVCGRAGTCSVRDYNRLMEKGKLSKERLEMLSVIKRHRLLTLPMTAFLLKMEERKLYEDLEALSEYGLVIKQFYEYMYDGENLRSEGFYCLSPMKPGLEPGRAGDFVWKKELKMEDAMSILAFNQFHIALTSNVPKKAVYARLNYLVRGACMDGIYHLKGRRYVLGYSHMIAVAVRDFAERNKGIADSIHKVWEHYAYGEEKNPWFVLICENKLQCANISRRIRARPDMAEIRVFFVLDTDLDFQENPLMVLQNYRFAGEGREIISETYEIAKWF